MFSSAVYPSFPRGIDTEGKHMGSFWAARFVSHKKTATFQSLGFAAGSFTMHMLALNFIVVVIVTSGTATSPVNAITRYCRRVKRNIGIRWIGRRARLGGSPAPNPTDPEGVRCGRGAAQTCVASTAAPEGKRKPVRWKTCRFLEMRRKLCGTSRRAPDRVGFDF